MKAKLTVTLSILAVLIVSLAVDRQSQLAPRKTTILDEPPGAALEGVGAPVWSRSGPWPWIRTPVIADGKAIVMMEHGILSALSLEDGAVSWEVEVGYVPSPPMLMNDVLYVGGGDNWMCAVRASDGQKLWRYEAFTPVEGDEKRNHDVTPLGFVGDAVLFDSTDSNVYALRRDTGTLAWKLAKPVCKPSGYSPDHFDAGILYMAGPGQVCAVEAATQKVLWKTETEVSDPGWLGKTGDRVFVTGGGKVEALSAAEGRVLWWLDLGTKGRMIDAIPVAGDRIAVLGGWDDPRVYMLDSASGKLLWVKKMSRFPNVGMADGKGRLWICLSDGTLAILDAADGTVLKEHAIGVHMFCVPVMAGEILLVGTRRPHEERLHERGVLTAYRVTGATP